MRYYPVFLDLRGRRCVVVGGGRVAERKVRTLLRAAARVCVVSADLTPRLALLASKKRIEVTPRAYRQGDLEGASLVFAATDDPATQQAVRADAEAVGALVNLADNREASTFLVPASFARGDLLVAVSTSGASPALARRLRRQLQTTLGSEYQVYLKFLRAARQQVKAVIPDSQQRTRVLREFANRLGADWPRKPRGIEDEVRRPLRKLGTKRGK